MLSSCLRTAAFLLPMCKQQLSAHSAFSHFYRTLVLRKLVVLPEYGLIWCVCFVLLSDSLCGSVLSYVLLSCIYQLQPSRSLLRVSACTYHTGKPGRSYPWMTILLPSSDLLVKQATNGHIRLPCTGARRLRRQMRPGYVASHIG